MASRVFALLVLLLAIFSVQSVSANGAITIEVTKKTPAPVPSPPPEPVPKYVKVLILKPTPSPPPPPPPSPPPPSVLVKKVIVPSKTIVVG